MATLGWLERDSHFWKVKLAGREAAQSIERMWEGICSERVAPEEERILRAVNRLGEGRAHDHAWLDRVHHTALLSEIGDSDLMKTLWPVSEDLEARGFVERDARIGPHLNLRPTYSGLVWQTKRESLGQPEVGHVLFLDILPAG